MSDVVNNSNIDWLQGKTTYRQGKTTYMSYCPEGSQYYLNI